MGLKHSVAEKNKDMEVEDDVSNYGSETLEILQEAELCEDDGEERAQEIQEVSLDDLGKCKKASLHRNYIPIENLKLDHFPKPIQHESILRYIQLRAQLVVKLTVRFTSTARPSDDPFAKGKSSRCATGYAWQYCADQTEIACPDESCGVSKNQHNVYRGILITTNRHVIYDNSEAVKTKVDFFLDGNEKGPSVTAKGYALREELETKDYVSLKIYHHDISLFNEIGKINKEISKAWNRIPTDFLLELDKMAIVISHPHGGSKRVSFGDLLDKEIFDEKNHRKVTRYTALTCSGSSGAPVLTASYMTNPFVHSSATTRKKKDPITDENKELRKFVGLSFSY